MSKTYYPRLCRNKRKSQELSFKNIIENRGKIRDDQDIKLSKNVQKVTYIFNWSPKRLLGWERSNIII